MDRSSAIDPRLQHFKRGQSALPMFLSVVSCDYGPLNAGHDNGMERHNQINLVRFKFLALVLDIVIPVTLQGLCHDVRCRVPAAIATVLEERSQTEQPAVGATWGGS
ncbi:hypothetical protein K439DRAFT_1623462 [Ramaria rubella]|nr:hypothetical protein K439DRAFT_1623462 [Ramaria rubella]